MKTLHKRCAGLDVHKAEVVACVRIITKRKVERETRRFPTTTKGLMDLAGWVENAGCTHVAMWRTIAPPPPQPRGGTTAGGGEELRASKMEPISRRAPSPTTDALFAQEVEQKRQQSSCSFWPARSFPDRTEPRRLATVGRTLRSFRRCCTANQSNPNSDGAQALQFLRHDTIASRQAARSTICNGPRGFAVPARP
jgi:hypothetical protein